MSPAESDALVFFGATGNLAGENVEVAAWRIVGPALGCSTPVHEHEPGAWGPLEADGLIARDAGWHCPSARAVAS